MDEAGGSGGLGVSCRDYLAVYGVKEDIICVYSTEKNDDSGKYDIMHITYSLY